MKAVHKYKKVWWFWDGQDKTKKRIGSYTSKVGAEAGLEICMQDKLNKNIVNNQNESIIDELTQLTDSDKNESECSCIDEIK